MAQNVFVILWVLSRIWSIPSIFTIVPWLFLLVLASSIWVSWDSAKMGLRRYESVLSCHPLLLFVLCSGLWPIVFPWYIWLKYRIVVGRAKAREANSSTNGGSSRRMVRFVLSFWAALTLLDNQPTPLPGQEWQVWREARFPLIILRTMFIPTTLSPNASDLEDSGTYRLDRDFGEIRSTSGRPLLQEKTRVLVLERSIFEMNSPVVKVKVLDGKSVGKIGYLSALELGPTLGDHISNALWTIWRSTLGKSMSYDKQHFL